MLILFENLKTAKVLPVYKSGNTKMFNNFRPISILPAISKTMERIVCNRLMVLLENITFCINISKGFEQNTLQFPQYCIC